MKKRSAFYLISAVTLTVLLSSAVLAGTYPYTQQPIPRDLILENCHLYYEAHWRCDPANAYGTSINNAECPYGTAYGWKATLPYCWGGDDEIYQYFEKMTADVGAGDKDTSSSSPYSNGLVGSVDCSGYASQCFRSGRYATSTFYNVTTEVGWDNLAPGDATNYAGSHIRMCELYPTDTGQILVYESTGTGWCIQHRLLAYDNNYAGVRYNFTTEKPSILDVVKTGSGEVTITWFGQADDSEGFRIYQSTDASNWSLIQDESTLDEDTYDTTVSGLSSDTIYYFQVRAITNSSESGPSATYPVRLEASAAQSVLLVDGYDRWFRKSSGSFNDFLVKYGKALDDSEVNFDSCNNFRVTRNEIDLSDYDAVVWMCGDESTAEYALNYLEETRLVSYLMNGGQLFISGSEIGWDLVDQEKTVDNLDVLDSDFYNNFLKADYYTDDAGVYSVTGVAGTIFEGLSFSFDDGTHGTYDVDYPDTIGTSGGSTVNLVYTSAAGNAAVEYSGTFSTGGGYATVDAMETLSGWWDPNTSAQTNTKTKCTFTVASSPVSEGSYSGDLYYVWGSGRWGDGDYIREYNSNQPPMPDDTIIYMDVYGDGNSHDMAIAVRDSADSDIFISDWITVSWTGWQTVSWDLATDNVNLWYTGGNGTLDGPQALFDSIHLTDGGSGGSGHLYFDNIRYYTEGETGSGKVVYIGFGFETIYPEASQFSVMDAVMTYFGL